MVTYAMHADDIIIFGNSEEKELNEITNRLETYGEWSR